ncbi:MAG: hypothetical protein AB7O88_21415 [Reyranellaceae bacterium]
MSVGEMSYLGLVVGCFVVFAVAVSWLRSDYVKHRKSGADDMGMHPAE